MTDNKKPERTGLKPFDEMRERVSELQKTGLDWGHAWGITDLEQQMKKWLTAWGDHLQIFICGDFEPPRSQMEFKHLGITVHPKKEEKTVVRSAKTVVKATVVLNEKSIPAIVDAIRRVNILLGCFTLVTWGNVACGWWSHITHKGKGGALEHLDHSELERATQKAVELPDQVRQKIESAMYWIRDPRESMYEIYRSDLLRVYAGYWNAFECLVDAVALLKPQKKLNKSQKQKRIDLFLNKKNGTLTPGDLSSLYRIVVDPGFPAKAKHALQVCFKEQDQWGKYAAECFEAGEDSLYQIRNDINHGEVDAENPEELLRIQAKTRRLWMIVWGMFGQIIPFSYPIERLK